MALIICSSLLSLYDHEQQQHFERYIYIYFAAIGSCIQFCWRSAGTIDCREDDDIDDHNGNNSRAAPQRQQPIDPISNLLLNIRRNGAIPICLSNMCSLPSSSTTPRCCGCCLWVPIAIVAVATQPCKQSRQCHRIQPYCMSQPLLLV